ncbi:MAG: ABC transporter permease [Clostridia bacterium]|nr:ABC transporter permease [Clostridia bacterium]
MSLFLHSVSMVKKNFKSYLLLSISILISFSLLLSYFLFQDSTIFNSNKFQARLPQEIVTLSVLPNEEDYTKKRETLTNYLDEIGASYYAYDMTNVKLFGYDHSVSEANVGIVYLPSDAFAYYTIQGGEYTKNILPEGKTLKKGEVWVSEQLYEIFSQNGDTEIGFSSYDDIFEHNGQGEPVFYRITETLRGYDGLLVAVMYDPAIHPSVQLSQFFVYAEVQYHEELVQFAEDLGANAGSTYQIARLSAAQNAQAAWNKAMLVIFLYFILAVNLYGSFKNALNDRKFEIGVKRAIGAGKGSIVAQFVSEGLLVMLGNLLLSAILVIDGFLLYKTILFCTQGIRWVIMLTPYSLLMYLVCCLGLSIVFSLLFAYQTTQVNVIENLRAE